MQWYVEWVYFNEIGDYIETRTNKLYFGNC